MKLYIDVTCIINCLKNSERNEFVREQVRKLLHDSRFEIVLVSFVISKNDYFIVINEKMEEFFQGRLQSKRYIFSSQKLYLEEINNGDVFLDLSDGFESTINRSELLPIIKNHNAKIATFLFEVDSIKDKTLCRSTKLLRYMNFLAAHLKYSDYIFTDKDNAKIINSLFQKLKMCGMKKLVLLEHQNRSTDNDKEYDFIVNWSVLLEDGKRKEEETSDVCQAVFLSARSNAVLSTLPYIEEYMQFIKEIVVCCPKRLQMELQKKYKGRLKITVLTDEEILGNIEAPHDAESRHFLLRCLAMKNECINNEFIMFDDDYRPMKKISIDTFYKDGKYQAYYFYDLREWESQMACEIDSYSQGALKTRDFLLSNGYPCLQYSSHMPQIICKKYYLEMINMHKGIEYMGLCEWSSYFNYCIAHHGERFSVKKYITLGWPGMVSDWEQMVIPEEYVFENYYPWNYTKGALFEKYSGNFTSKTSDENVEKIEVMNGIVQKHLIGNQVRADIEREYRNEYGIMPSIVFGHNNTEMEMYVPCEYSILAGSISKITVSVCSTYDYESKNAQLVWHIEDKQKNWAIGEITWNLKNNRKKISICVIAPENRMEGFLVFVYKENGEEISTFEMPLNVL